LILAISEGILARTARGTRLSAGAVRGKDTIGTRLAFIALDETSFVGKKSRITLNAQSLANGAHMLAR